MARHFLSLYLLIVVTLAAVSWGQDRLLQAYSAQEPADDRALAVAVLIVQNELRNLPAQQWRSAISDIGEKSGVDMELFALPEIAGRETLAKLKRGEIAHMQAAGESWALKQLNEDFVFALKTVAPDTG